MLDQLDLGGSSASKKQLLVSTVLDEEGDVNPWYERCFSLADGNALNAKKMYRECTHAEIAQDTLLQIKSQLAQMPDED